MYANAGLSVRSDIVDAHQQFWQRLAQPGAWWTAAQRIDIAAETRHAPTCALCLQRRADLSPEWAQGSHDAATALPAPAVEAIHRITTDPSRLSRAWFERIVPDALSPGAYVELVGTLVFVLSIDAFAEALGEPLLPLPEPTPGDPSRYTPSGATQTDAWVPMIPPENAVGPEADIYGGRNLGNVLRALSLVPDHVRSLEQLSAAQYLPSHLVRDPSARQGALLRSQTELVAARVAAQSGCFY